MTHSYTSHQVFLGVYHLLYMLFWIVFMWWVHHNQTIIIIIIIMNISIIIIILVIISSRFYSHGIVNKSLVSSKVNTLWGVEMVLTTMNKCTIWLTDCLTDWFDYMSYIMMYTSLLKSFYVSMAVWKTADLYSIFIPRNVVSFGGKRMWKLSLIYKFIYLFPRIYLGIYS